MTEHYSPTVRRRRLSAELRRIRKAADVTYDGIAKDSGIPRSTINNIEIGKKQRPTLVEVTAFLDACKVEDAALRQEILELCRQSHRRGWWNRYRDVLPGQYPGFEAEAAAIATWEPLLVPGLLQIPEYMELIGRAALAKAADVKRMIQARLERQAILDRAEPSHLWAVFDEGALHRLTRHPDVLRAQVEKLLQRAEEPHITLQMTVADDLHPALSGPFVIMDFSAPADLPIVYLETDTDGLYLEEYDEVARYRQVSDHLRLAALRPGETIDRLTKMIE